MRDERARASLVDDTTTTTGSDGLSIGRGDLIPTRKNSADPGVANRQQRIVQHVEADGSLWIRDAHSDRKREHSIHLPVECVREYTHLSYVATAYGVQGGDRARLAHRTWRADGRRGRLCRHDPRPRDKHPACRR